MPVPPETWKKGGLMDPDPAVTLTLTVVASTAAPPDANTVTVAVVVHSVEPGRVSDRLVGGAADAGGVRESDSEMKLTAVGIMAKRMLLLNSITLVFLSAVRGHDRGRR